MIKLYTTALSGHGHRVEQLLKLLKLDYEKIDAPHEVRITTEFLKINPLGQIPVLTDNEVVLSDSNTILLYLVQKYDRACIWYAKEIIEQAEIHRWLFIASGEIAFGPALAKRTKLLNGDANLEEAHARAHKILNFMNNHLKKYTWLALNKITIADLACYPYIAVADEGGISLDGYEHVKRWIKQVEEIQGISPMPKIK
ncbi:glutathione S-transferase family protein [Acinetobacter nectaris]|uniref:glutathione S-transferase family protein n=1 Tax=Acinetobacter nectaris TaxID=1219382 RepID=UPI001F01F94E|nr:glutathione S-transferase N-terminal domain-containing protein [Acinetobacter nectaris]